MGFAPIFGVAAGILVTSFKNGLCYMPWYRRPWEHVLSAAAGAYVCQWIVDKEDDMVKQIEEHYAKLEQQQQQQGK